MAKDTKMVDISDEKVIEKQMRRSAGKGPSDEELKRGVLLARSRLNALLGKAVDTILDIMENGGGREKLEAAKIVLRSQGLDATAETAADGTLTVLLPNGVNVSPSPAPRTLIVETEAPKDEV